MLTKPPRNTTKSVDFNLTIPNLIDMHVCLFPIIKLEARITKQFWLTWL